MNRNIRTFDTINRRGFTLIELLVVIAIIAILAGLTAWGVFAMIGNRQARNTEASIKTINKVLQSHWKYVIEEADKDKDVSPAVMAMAGGDPARARVLWKKFRLMEAFPQSFAEVNNPWIYLPDPLNPANGPFIPATGPGSPRRYISKYKTALSAVPASSESSVCLLLALSVSRGGGATALNADVLGPGVADVNGVKQIVDGWGVPIGFFRFAWQWYNPTTGQMEGIPNPASGGSAAAAQADPIDTRGTLIYPAWYGNPNPYRVLFESKFHPTWVSGSTPRKAYYVIPVIASSGGTPNVTPVPGLNADLSIAQSANYIYSFKLQLD